VMIASVLSILWSKLLNYNDNINNNYNHHNLA
jgi:hypothetical protein